MCERKRLRFYNSCELSLPPLLFSTIIIIVSELLLAKGADVNLISERLSATQQRKYKLWCVINNSTSAISWISSDMNKGNNSAVSEFYPKLNETFSCDLSANHECTFDWLKKSWKLSSSKEYYFGPILDRRWEKFKIYTTTKKTNALHVGRFSGDFHVPFSVKIGHDAQIYLCNGPFEHSICYWLIIGGLYGKTTVLRKCNNREKNTFSKFNSCDKYKRFHNNKNLLPVKEDEWRHFVVSKNGSMISLRYAENDTALLEYEDEEKDGNDYFEMYVNSHFVSGLWKVHDYDFFYANISSTTKLGPLIQPVETDRNGRKTYYLCVQMFAIICLDCSMTLELSNQENSYEKTFQSKILNGWEEIRYIQENVVPSSGYYSMKIVTRGKNGGFWAIDDVRQCSREEVRVLTITVDADEQVSCQTLEFPSKVLRKTDEMSLLIENYCPVGTFGKDCSPCELVFGEESKFCQNKKACFFDKNFDQICQCAAGYQGKYCDQVCEINRYGYNCNGQCGHCYDGEACDTITGKCYNGCSHGFIGDTCEISASIPIFLNTPIVLKVGSTFVDVQRSDTTTLGNLSKPGYYKFQISINKLLWRDVGDVYSLEDTSAKRVQNLEASNIYHFRAVIVSRDGIKYESDFIPSTSFETACIPMTKDHIVIVPQNISAEITIKPEYADMCPIEKYKVHVNGTEVEFFDNSAVLKNLRPFTSYTVKFIKTKIEDLEVNFTTLEGAPDVVNDVQLTKEDSTSINIKWQPPHNPNGIIRYYTIVYKNIGNLYCSQNMYKTTGKFSTKLDHIKHNYAKLSNLEPYSKYSIEIYANTFLPGKHFVLQESTLESNEIDTKELPSDIKTKATNTSVIAELSKVPCEKRKGPIEIDVSVESLNKPRNNSKTLNMEFNEYPFEIKDLKPFSEYEIDIRFKRTIGKTNESRVLTTKFKTLPGVAGHVRNLTIYAQTESEVFLSWLPPYPENGVLQYYQVITYCHDHKKYGYFVPKSCTIWKEKHCAKIVDLYKELRCNFQVFAKNQGVNLYNYEHPIPTVVKPSASKDSTEPKMLKAQWKNDDHLLLFWVHPNFTNGLIAHFEIVIENENFGKWEERYDIANYDSCSFNYTYQIKSSLAKSRKYSISVRAVTDLNYGLMNTIEIYSYPEKPALIADPVANAGSGVINLHIPPYDKTKSSPDDKSYLFVIISEDSLYCNRSENSKIELIRQANESETSCIILEKPLKEIDSELTLQTGHNEAMAKPSFLEKLDELSTPFHENATYNISVLLLNEYFGRRTYNLYKMDVSYVKQSLFSASTTSKDNNVTLIISILSVILVVFVVNLFILNTVWNRYKSVDKKSIEETLMLADVPSKELANSTFSVKEEMTPHLQNLLDKLTYVYDNSTLIRPILNVYSKEIDEANNCQRFSVASTKLQGHCQVLQDVIERNLAMLEDGYLKPTKSTRQCNSAFDFGYLKFDKHSNFENPTYVDGYKKQKAYIAVKGLEASAICDFWKMIWQRRVYDIVMLENLCETGEKSDVKYWPVLSESVRFGDISVKCVSLETSFKYECRMFNVNVGNESRRVKQLQLTSWPDHNSAKHLQNFVSFFNEMSLMKYDHPIVVQSSVDLGKIGTVILCDINLRMADVDGRVDFFGTKQNILKQHENIICNSEQYLLAHFVILECFMSSSTSVSCGDNLVPLIRQMTSNGVTEKHFDYLENTNWQDKTLEDIRRKINKLSKTPSKINTIKSFLDNISKYEISAMTVYGYDRKFIVTEQPPLDSVGDFWKKIIEERVTTIISLNNVFLDSLICPDETHPEIQPLQHIIVRYKNTVEDALIKKVFLEKIHTPAYPTSENDRSYGPSDINQTVCFVIVKDSKRPSSETVISLYKTVKSLSKKNEPIVLTTYDNDKTEPELFVVSMLLLEKMEREKVCDVCSTIRLVRRQYKRKIVNSEEQLRFLYETASKFYSIYRLENICTEIVKKP